MMQTIRNNEAGSVPMAPNYTVKFPSLEGQVSEEEWAARADLAACYRLMDRYGMTDMIYNHITNRISGKEDRILINLYGLLYREITASSLVEIDYDGKIIRKPETAYTLGRAGWVIHGCIHRARPDVHCVIHTHTRAGMAVSAMRSGLLCITQTASRFHNRIAYHNFEGPATDTDEQARLVEDLGSHNAMILRNHGLLTCGASVAQAFNLMYQLEMSCRAQVDAMAAGLQEIIVPDDAVLDRSSYLFQPAAHRAYGELEWHALMRMLEMEPGPYPSFRS